MMTNRRPTLYVAIARARIEGDAPLLNRQADRPAPRADLPPAGGQGAFTWGE